MQSVYITTNVVSLNPAEARCTRYNIIHLLTGYEGNSTFIVPKVPSIFRGNAEENSWYRGDNKSDTTRKRVITKLPNTVQSSKGKGKTHKSTNRQNQSTTGKLGKPQWSWLGTGISKEMVGWIRFYGAKPLASITVKRFRLSL